MDVHSTAFPNQRNTFFELLFLYVYFLVILHFFIHFLFKFALIVAILRLQRMFFIYHRA